MKISAITGVNTANNCYLANKNLNSSEKYQGRTNTVAFGYDYKMWNQFKLNILHRTKSELKDLAEYFHKLSPSELEDVAKIKNFFGIKSKKRSKKSYELLQEAVNAVLLERKSIDTTLKILKSKEEAGKLSQDEKMALSFLKKRLAELDKKFESREEEFAIEVELLSKEDIDYFNRYSDYP